MKHYLSLQNHQSALDDPAPGPQARKEAETKRYCLRKALLLPLLLLVAFHVYGQPLPKTEWDISVPANEEGDFRGSITIDNTQSIVARGLGIKIRLTPGGQLLSRTTDDFVGGESGNSFQHPTIGAVATSYDGNYYATAELRPGTVTNGPPSPTTIVVKLYDRQRNLLWEDEKPGWRERKAPLGATFDQRGSLYILQGESLFGNTSLRVYKYPAANCNTPVEVNVYAPEQPIQTGDLVEVSADLGGRDIPGHARIRWNWGDGSIMTQTNVRDNVMIDNHRYQQAGRYLITLDFSFSCYKPKANTHQFWIEIKDPHTISAPALPAMTVGGAPVELMATATSGLPVQVEVISGPFRLEGNQLTATGPGGACIRFTQPGNDQYLPATPVDRCIQIKDPGTIFNGQPLPIVEWERGEPGIQGPSLSYDEMRGTITIDDNQNIVARGLGVEIKLSPGGQILSRTNYDYVAGEFGNPYPHPKIRAIATSYDGKYSATAALGPEPTSSYFPYYYGFPTITKLYDHQNDLIWEHERVGIYRGKSTPMGATFDGLGNLYVLVGESALANNYLRVVKFPSSCGIPIEVNLNAPADPVQTGNMVVVSATVSGRFIPPDANLKWNWGDGTTTQAVIGGDAIIYGNHQYQKFGTYTATLDFSYTCYEPASNTNQARIAVKDPQRITGVAGWPRITVGGPPLQVMAATTSSGLPVQVEVISGPLKLEGNLITATGPGKSCLRFTQPGNDQYLPAGPQISCIILEAPVVDAVPAVTDSSQTMVQVGLNLAQKTSLRAFPNPMVGQSTVEFTVAKAGQVLLEVYDMKGALVHRFYQEQAEPGRIYTLALEVSQWPEGFYLCRLRGNKSHATYRIQVGK